MSDWTLEYNGFDPEFTAVREALCTLGNGYICTRGALAFSKADGINYPGAYLAGGYNRLVTEVGGRAVSNEDLVNMPNWLDLSVHDATATWSDFDSVEVVDFNMRLRLDKGCLEQDLLLRDSSGRELEVAFRRVVHMVRPHIAVQEMTLRPRGWSGRINVTSALDGTVVNSNVKRYDDLANQHLERIDEDADGDLIRLRVRTVQSEIVIALAARTRVHRRGEHVHGVERVDRVEPAHPAQVLSFDVSDGEETTIAKVVALYTSRDNAISEPLDQATLDASRAPDFGILLEEQSLAWDKNWRICDLVIGEHEHKPDRPSAQLILRLHIFQILQTVSRYSADIDVGVPARGWHGEAYRGHIFWDEIYIYPFLYYHIPEITRGLLRYRHRRLNEAREAARAQGFRGAMFPWQSGSNGREETQTVHLNPTSGQWITDASHLQRHVGAAIAYNAWHYYTVTGDYEFFSSRCAVLILEIAKFWGSIAHHNPERDRYEIHGVMGPDEFHEHYPGNPEPGFKNNAYTNVMASWVAETALKSLETLNSDRRIQLTATLDITPEDTARWVDMSRKMFIPIENGIIQQFEGYDELKEFDWAGYREKYGRINRLDRILDAEGDNTDNYKLSKQADVLMLPYLFSNKALREIFERLGYEHDDDLVRRNYDYYVARTSHGSTLSYIVHAAIAARFDKDAALEMYDVALTSDVADVQGGTTGEGIHLGVMAGTVDVMMRSFLGLEIRGDALCFDPPLAGGFGDFSFLLRFRRTWIEVDGSGNHLRIHARPGGRADIEICVGDTYYHLRAGHAREFTL